MFYLAKSRNGKWLNYLLFPYRIRSEKLNMESFQAWIDFQSSKEFLKCFFLAIFLTQTLKLTWKIVAQLDITVNAQVCISPIYWIRTKEKIVLYPRKMLNYFLWDTAARLSNRSWKQAQKLANTRELTPLRW